MKQKGFTLVELLVAMAVGSLILTGAVLSIYQIVWGTSRSNSQVVALTGINQAALAIRNDLLMTQTTDLSSTPKSSANLTWIDYTTSFGSGGWTSHSSVYTLNGTALMRSYDSTVGIVGRNVISLSFSQTGQFVTVVIATSNTTPPSQIETIEFGVHLRTEEIK